MKSGLLFLFLLVLISCKKEKDTTSFETINGQVFNLSTDSGLTGIKVYLQEAVNGTINKTVESVSGQNGNFSFPNSEIHSSDKYSYSLNIPSKSGFVNVEVGFNGDMLVLNKEKLGEAKTLKVVPKFNLITTSVVNPTLDANDSLTILYEQKLYQKNVPGYPYSFGGGAHGNQTNFSFNSTNYPMGYWHLTVEKWKGGVYTKTLDSLYMGWGETKTYTISW